MLPIRKDFPGKSERIYVIIGNGLSQITFTISIYKRHIKTANIVPDQSIILYEIHEIFQHTVKMRCISHHLIRDIIHHTCRIRNRFTRINQMAEFIYYPAISDLHRRNLNHLIRITRNACSLQIKQHIIRCVII